MFHHPRTMRHAIALGLAALALAALALAAIAGPASAQCNPVLRVSEAHVPDDPPPRDRIDAIFERLQRSPQLYDVLGCPVDFFGTSKGGGAFIRMERGMIYAPPNRAAFEIHGAILDKWGEYDWEHGPLGYVVSDELSWNTFGKYNAFEKGLIVWTSDYGAHAIYPPFQDAFLSHPGFAPTSEQFVSGGAPGECPKNHRQQNFMQVQKRALVRACYDANTRVVTWKGGNPASVTAR